MPVEIVMNHATFRKAWRFDAFVEACAAAGMRRVSIWGNEVAEIGLDAARARLRDSGMRAFGYNRAGPLLAGDPARRAELMAAAKAEIETAAALGSDHILLFPGGLPGGSKGLAASRSQTADACAILNDHAGNCGIALALEPLHPMLAGDRTALCTLAEANRLCDRLGANAGIVIDSYHVWWDAELEAQTALAGSRGRILGFHVNDWLIPTRDMVTDRGMMGDGVIDLAGMWSMVLRAGYDGPVEVEIFSEHWWAQDPDEVLALALERCAAIFSDEAAR